MPACAARPIAFTVKRPTPLRAVFNAPPGSEGSRTRTARHCAASVSIKARDELLPTSSSLVKEDGHRLSSSDDAHRHPHQKNSGLHVENARARRPSVIDLERPLRESRLPATQCRCGREEGFAPVIAVETDTQMIAETFRAERSRPGRRFRETWLRQIARTDRRAVCRGSEIPSMTICSRSSKLRELLAVQMSQASHSWLRKA